jgi:hypothetical protein
LDAILVSAAAGAASGVVSSTAALGLLDSASPTAAAIEDVGDAVTCQLGAGVFVRGSGAKPRSVGNGDADASLVPSAGTGDEHDASAAEEGTLAAVVIALVGGLARLAAASVALTAGSAKPTPGALGLDAGLLARDASAVVNPPFADELSGLASPAANPAADFWVRSVNGSDALAV